MISRFYKPAFDKCMIFYEPIISDKKGKLQGDFCLTFWKTGNIITNERVADLRKSSFLLFVFLFLYSEIAMKKCVAYQRKFNLQDKTALFLCSKRRM